MKKGKIKDRENPKSPYFETYLLSLTLEKVESMREILKDNVKEFVKIKKIKEIIPIHWWERHKMDRLVGVFQALENFLEIENSMDSKYSQEEILAGIKELPSDGNSLAITIGKMFMIDPDIILTKWQYIKILGILKHSYNENEYRKRLQIVYQNKQKLK